MYTPRTTQYEHQKNEFDKHWADHARGWFWSMGSGKSKQLIDNAAALYQANCIKGLCVFSNKGSYRNMAKELDIHLPVDIPVYVHTWSGGNTKKERTSFVKMYNFDGLRVLLMNVESQVSEKGKSAALHFVQRQPTMLAVDESSTIKNPKAQRTKAILDLSRFCIYRRVMTGTPITNSPLDIYSQAEVLKERALGFSNFWAFRSNYAILKEINTGQRGFKMVVGYRCLDDLKERIDRIASVVKKEDCLDLPEKIYTTYDVDLSKEQRSAYAAMRDDAIVALETQEKEGRIVTAQNVLTRLMRLQQIVCGFVGGEEGQEDTQLKHGRLDALMSILAEVDGKAIIYAPWRASLKEVFAAVSKKYSGQVVRYFGGVSDEEREEAVDSFQNGDARFLVANQQTAGYGLTLTAAHTVIYYAQTYKLEERLQSEDRIHRIGQDQKCIYVTLRAPDTVDEKIAEALVKKKNIAGMLVQSNWRDLV